jgi:hypothetical protein
MAPRMQPRALAVSAIPATDSVSAAIMASVFILVSPGRVGRARRYELWNGFTTEKLLI